MSNEVSTSSGGGIGLGGILFIVFLVLKLTHTVDWRWIWVFSPLWIPVGLVLFIILLVAIIS